MDAVATLSGKLLRTCPELRILATSREALDIEGEAIRRVPPLTIPDTDDELSLRGLPQYDAVTLFMERAAAAVSRFELIEDNRITVAHICRALEGLPLPIELAAARLRAMSADQIAERLNDRYKLLTLGSRGAPRAPTDAAVVNGLELRPMQFPGTAAVGTLVGIRRNLRIGCGGGYLRGRGGS